MKYSKVLKITRMGDPALALPAKEVLDPTAPEVRESIEYMLTTAGDCGNLCGLAAPQVKIPYRIALFSVPKDKGDEIPLTVMINPMWEPASEDIESDWEGCLSIPGLVGSVPRYTHIRYSYQTLQGDVVKAEAKGFHARVVQHECDHLDGTLYVQRMTDLSRISFLEEFRKYIQKI